MNGIPTIANTLLLAFAPGEAQPSPDTEVPVQRAEAPSDPATAGDTPTTAPTTKPATSAPAVDPIPPAVPLEPADPVAPAPQVTDDEPAPRSERRSAPPSPVAGNSVLAGGTRPGFVSVHVGSARALKNAEDLGGVFGTTTNVLIEEAFGWHLNGTGDGAALGLALQQVFGMGTRTYMFGARLEGDVRVAKAFAVYATPSFTLGYKLVRLAGVYNEPDPNCDEGYGGYYDPTPGCDVESEHQLSAQFGLGIKAVLGDRLIISFRPVGLELAGPHIARSLADGDGREDQPFLVVRWQLVGGFGLTF